MKKFKFRLERVLSYRLVVKEEKRRVLAIKNIQLQQAEESLAQMETAQLASLVDEGQSRVEEIEVKARFWERLRQDLINQRLFIIQCQDEVEQAMQEYLEAVKEAKALQTLKDRKLEEYRELTVHEEIKFLDELATQKGNTLLEK